MLDLRPSPTASRPGLVIAGLAVATCLLLVVVHGLQLVEFDAGPFSTRSDQVVTAGSDAAEPSGSVEIVGGDGPPQAPVADRPPVEPDPPPARAPEEPPLDALWPARWARQPYTEPRDVARAFAARYLGFATTSVDGYEPIDDDVGVVSVQATPDGPVTSILVHRLSTDGSWWVLAASSDAVIVDDPTTGETLGDPVHVQGTARTSAGVVTFELRLVGRDDPVLAREFRTGGGDEPQWFEGSFGWSDRQGGRGAAVLSVSDPAGDGVLAATVVPVVIPGGSTRAVRLGRVVAPARPVRGSRST